MCIKYIIINMCINEDLHVPTNCMAKQSPTSYSRVLYGSCDRGEELTS